MIAICSNKNNKSNVNISLIILSSEKTKGMYIYTLTIDLGYQPRGLFLWNDTCRLSLVDSINIVFETEFHKFIMLPSSA